MAAAVGDAQLFEDTFTITDIDHAKYARCGRISCVSADAQTVMSLDINTELFPCVAGESLRVVLSTTLSLDGSKDDEKGWRDTTKGSGGEATLADMYDYVCCGTIYKFEESDSASDIKVFISFGGLLMSLQGPFKKLTPLRVEKTYLLIKK